MFQKKALLSALIAGAAILGFSAIASADLPGFYAGGELGWSNIHDSDNPFNTEDGGTGLGAGAQFGYQFNPYIAAEAGYLYFSNAKQDGNFFGPWSYTYKEQAVDLVAKGTLPLNQYISLYAKGGAAYVDASDEGRWIGFGDNNGYHPIRPVYGLGVSYNITPNVSADLGWTRVQNNNAIPNADIATLGLTYHFG